jgi:hypothetical protein
MPRVRGSCRAPLGKRLSVVLESFRAAGGAHCLHLLEGGIGRRWVRVTRGSRWCALSSPPADAVGQWVAGAGYSGAAESRIVFTSSRWRGRWVVSASYSGVMVVRMVFISRRGQADGRSVVVTRGWRCRAFCAPSGSLWAVPAGWEPEIRLPGGTCVPIKPSRPDHPVHVGSHQGALVATGSICGALKS